MQRAFITLVVALFAVLFAVIAIDYTERQTLPPLAASYVERVPQELGAPNIITGILLHLSRLRHARRGRGAFHGRGERRPGARRQRRAAGMPCRPKPERVIRFDRTRAEWRRDSASADLHLRGLYHHERAPVCRRRLSGRCDHRIRRHAAAAGQARICRLDHDFLGITESLAGVLYVLAGIAGLVFAGGFLDSRILPLGQFGAFFSAGAIPVISALLGIKVGCELSVIIDRFRS